MIDQSWIKNLKTIRNWTKRENFNSSHCAVVKNAKADIFTILTIIFTIFTDANFSNFRVPIETSKQQVEE